MSSSRENGLARTLLSGTTWLSLSQLLQLAINLTMTPYVIHGLGSARYSIFLMVSTLTLVMGQFDGGIGAAAQRYFSVGAGSGDHASNTRLFATTFALISSVGLVMAVGAWFASGPILGFFKVAEVFRAEATVLFRVLAIIVAVLFVRNLFQSLLFSHQQFRTVATAGITSYLVYAAGLVVTVEQGWGLRGIAATFVAQQVVASLVTVPAASRWLRLRDVGWVDRVAFKQFVLFALRAQVTGLLMMFTAQKDQLVTARILSAQQSGPYGQGANFAQQLRNLPANALSPIETSIARSLGADGVDGAATTAERIQSVWVKLICGWFAVGVPAAYFGLQAWLPTSFHLASPVAAILLGGQWIAAAGAVLRIWGLVLGHAELDLWRGVAEVAVNIVLSIVGYLVAGVLGIVAGTSLSQMVSMLFLDWLSRRRMSRPLRHFLSEVPVIAAVVTCVLTAALEWLARPCLPSGVVGLLAAGALATPGLLVFASLTIGWRTSWGAVQAQVHRMRR